MNRELSEACRSLAASSAWRNVIASYAQDLATRFVEAAGVGDHEQVRRIADDLRGSGEFERWVIARANDLLIEERRAERAARERPNE